MKWQHAVHKLEMPFHKPRNILWVAKLFVGDAFVAVKGYYLVPECIGTDKIFGSIAAPK